MGVLGKPYVRSNPKNGDSNFGGYGLLGGANRIVCQMRVQQFGVQTKML